MDHLIINTMGITVRKVISGIPPSPLAAVPGESNYTLVELPKEHAVMPITGYYRPINHAPPIINVRLLENAQSVWVSWTLPPNCVTPDGYHVCIRSCADRGWEEIVYLAHTENLKGCFVSGFTLGTHYTFAVRSIYRTGRYIGDCAVAEEGLLTFK